jgi:hypothetical protein
VKIPFTIVRAAVVAAGAAVVGLAGAPASAAPAPSPSEYHDAASGVTVTGVTVTGLHPPTPAVTSTTGTVLSAVGPAQTVAGLLAFSSASVRAGNTEAASTVRNLLALHGTVFVSSAHAYCHRGAAESSALLLPTRPLPPGASISRDVRFKNEDGSTTVTALVIQLAATAGLPATTISIATATCAADREFPRADTAWQSVTTPRSLRSSAVGPAAARRDGGH